MPLAMTRAGQKLCLKEIMSGYKLRKRLEDLGMTPGVRFSVITNSMNGPLILDVRGARIAIGRGMAQKILVEVH